MKIRQILNNNVALVQRGDSEIIAVAKGIGFKKKPGHVISDAEIEKVFIPDSYDMLEHFSYLLANSDPNDIILINDIIAYGEKKLETKVSAYLSLTLLDHLEYLFERIKKQQFIKSPLYWDIKRFYPQHFQIGLYALEQIRTYKKIAIPEDESVAIALHFINLEDERASSDETIREMKTLNDIVSIIKMQYKLVLDEESLNYLRFITHLQFFIRRVMNQEFVTEDNSTQALYQQVSQLYPKSFETVRKIRIYIKKTFNYDISINEETYLMLHINRLTQRIGEI